MPTPTRRRTTSLWAACLVAGTVLSGCGSSSEPEPLEAMTPDVPADLCAAVPADARKGLEESSSSDAGGNPTAACSLRSKGGASPEVRAVITWLQTDDELSADEVLDSQCRAIDRRTYKVQKGFSAEGSEKACAGSGKVDGADSTTMAANTGLEVVTVRLSSRPQGDTPALQRGRQMLEGVLAELGGS